MSYGIGHNSRIPDEKLSKIACEIRYDLAKRWKNPEYVAHINTLEHEIAAYTATMHRDAQYATPDQVGAMSEIERHNVIMSALLIALKRVYAARGGTADVLICMFIAGRSSNAYGRCTDGLDKIAKAWGLSNSTAKRSVRWLCHEGLIRREGRAGETSALSLLVPTFLLSREGSYTPTLYSTLDALIGPPSRARGRPSKQVETPPSAPSISENLGQLGDLPFSENLGQLGDLPFSENLGQLGDPQKRRQKTDDEDLDEGTAAGQDFFLKEPHGTRPAITTPNNLRDLTDPKLKSPTPTPPRGGDVDATSGVNQMACTTNLSVVLAGEVMLPAAKQASLPWEPQEDQLVEFNRLHNLIREKALGAHEPREHTDALLCRSLSLARRDVDPDQLRGGLDMALASAEAIISAARENRPFNGRVPSQISNLGAWITTNIGTQIKRYIAQQAEIALAPRVAANKIARDLEIEDAKARADIAHHEAREKLASKMTDRYDAITGAKVEAAKQNAGSGSHGREGKSQKGAGSARDAHHGIVTGKDGVRQFDTDARVLNLPYGEKVFGTAAIDIQNSLKGATVDDVVAALEAAQAFPKMELTASNVTNVAKRKLLDVCIERLNPAQFIDSPSITCGCIAFPEDLANRLKAELPNLDHITTRDAAKDCGLASRGSISFGFDAHLKLAFVSAAEAAAARVRSEGVATIGKALNDEARIFVESYLRKADAGGAINKAAKEEREAKEALERAEREHQRDEHRKESKVQHWSECGFGDGFGSGRKGGF